MEVPKWGTGAEPLAAGSGAKPQNLKKHCKLYTLKKVFCGSHTWCQNDETVILPATLYRVGEGRVT